MVLYYLLILLIPYQSHGRLAEVLFLENSLRVTPIKLVGVLTLIYSLYYLIVLKKGNDVSSIVNKLSITVIIFFMLCILSGMLHPAPGVDMALSQVYSFFVFFIPTVILIDDEKKIQKVFLVSIVSMVLASRTVFMEFYHFHGIVPGFRPWTSFGDPNYYSLSALIVIAVILSMLSKEENQILKYALTFSLVIMVTSLFFAASRGGMLGLLVIVIYHFVRSRNKVKIVAASVLLLSILIVALPDHLTDRLMIVPLGGLRSGRVMSESQMSSVESSARRFELAMTGIYMFIERPLLGIGFGNFRHNSVRYNPDLIWTQLRGVAEGVAHSTYIEVLAEMGIVGITLFFLIILFVFKLLLSTPINEKTSVIRNSIMSGMIGYLVSATFLSATFIKFFWLMIFLTICMKSITEQYEEESLLEPSGEYYEVAGL